MGRKILIVDDEQELAEVLAALMGREGLKPVIAGDGVTALQIVRSESPDVLLVDFRLPGMNGLEVLRQAKELDEDLPVILITAFAEVKGAVDAMRAGAHDYLSKPFNHPEVVRVVLRALAERELKLQLKDLSSQVRQSGTLREVMGPSDAVGLLIAGVQRVAKSNLSVLITGETGSGKEVIARAVHEASSRRAAPFVPVDCGAIPEALLESELFGYERGAFTGALQQKPGRFEMAERGTLFLDEISNLPLPSQAKLLRVLQDKALYRIGGTRAVSADVRMVSASNHDLEQQADGGWFRQDLLFRLNEFAIHIPPLRERRDDIPYLANRFLNMANTELGKQVKGFAESAIDAMLVYFWPGNVRQLRSVIRRAVLLADDMITNRHLNLPVKASNEKTRESSVVPEIGDVFLKRSLREIVKHHTARVEREVLQEVLRCTGGNKSRAARMLQIDYKTLQSKVREYAIQINGEQSYGRKEEQRTGAQ